MSEFSEMIGMETGNAFKSGYNCCEAIVQAFRTVGGMTIDDNAFRMCSGFGGGIGHARDLCGGLAGSIMVISTLAGRMNPQEKPLGEIYPLTEEYYHLFVQEFGSAKCGDLMPYEFNTRDHLKNCLKLINRMGKFLAEFLETKGLLTKV